MKRINFIAGFLVIAVSGYFYYLSNSFPSIKAQLTGPAFMPRFYIYVLVDLSIILILNSLRLENNKISGNIKMVFISMGLVFLYAVLIPNLGFYVSTLFFLTTLLWVSKVRKPITLITIPIGTLLFLFLFFQTLLKVPLPTGIFF